MFASSPRRSPRYSAFERKRRAVSRWALYGSALISAGAAVAFVATLQRPTASRESERFRDVDFAALKEVRQLQDYVRIDTSDATGDEVAGARFLADQLAAIGIPAHVEVMGPRKANLWAILEGDDPRAIVLHSHIDVENIHPTETWETPPFEARLDLPWMYGRGVFDMKSVAIAQIAALAKIKASGRRPSRSVIFLATSSEETGSGLGVRWLLANRPDLASRFGLVLTEGGFVEARSRSEIKYWGIEVGQKHYVYLELCGADRAPLDEIKAYLDEAGERTGPLRIEPSVREYFRRYAPTRDDPRIRSALSDPDGLLAEPSRFPALPRYLKGFFRDEALTFDVQEAPGGGFRLLVVLHLLPDSKVEDALDLLVPRGLRHGLATSLNDPAPGVEPSSSESADFRAIVDAIEARYPVAKVGPALLPWTATDARYFRAAGIPSYGFSPFLILSTDTLQVDNANERMAMPGFIDGVRLYEDLLSKLTL